MIFLPLLAIFIGISLFGFLSQGARKEAKDELLRDIEQATKKSAVEKKAFLKDRWNFDSLTAVDTIDGYRFLLERSPFFRVVTEQKLKTKEAITLKEEPKKPLFKYKGRVMMGSKVMVIIEDQGTGKSSFVQEGDMVGDFLVLRVDEKEVALKKKGGEEIVLSAVKKEVKKEEKE